MGNVPQSGGGDNGVQLQFFSRRGSLEFLRRFKTDSPTVDFKNVDGFIGAIVASGKATLKELKESYTLEDAFDLWEVIAVTNYNEFLAIEHARKANK